MQANDMYIELKGIQIYAFHGVLPQEREVGSYFYIDLKLKNDFTRAAETDQLKETVSYADIYEVIKEEMGIPSNLLENVCYRIATHLFKNFPSIELIDISLYKENPPMGTCAQHIGIKAQYTR